MMKLLFTLALVFCLICDTIQVLQEQEYKLYRDGERAYKDVLIHKSNVYAPHGSFGSTTLEFHYPNNPGMKNLYNITSVEVHDYYEDVYAYINSGGAGRFHVDIEFTSPLYLGMYCEILLYGQYIGPCTRC